MNSEIFLTDADYKHTLGQKGLQVDVGSNVSLMRQIGAFSKYTHQAFVYPDPKLSPEKFLKFITELCRKKRYNVIIPIGYNSTVTLSRFKDKVALFAKLPVANYEKLRIAASKDETLALAEKLGISAPDTIMVKKINLDKAKTLQYPLVVKGITESGRAYHVNSPQELVEKFLSLEKTEHKPPLIQEYIRGHGYGFFALFNYGKPRAIFMHRRIREYPIIGGPSSAAESVYEPKLKESGLKILNALNWHGVAMVEFKRDITDNKFKLMEINTKFWGSLDLAIASGVDFPYLLYKMAIEGDIKPIFNYKVGVKFMWPFPEDTLHVLANPSAFPEFAKDLTDVSVKKNIMFRDVRPNFMQVIETIFALHKIR